MLIKKRILVLIKSCFYYFVYEAQGHVSPKD